MDGHYAPCDDSQRLANFAAGGNLKNPNVLELFYSFMTRYFELNCCVGNNDIARSAAVAHDVVNVTRYQKSTARVDKECKNALLNSGLADGLSLVGLVTNPPERLSSRVSQPC